MGSHPPTAADYADANATSAMEALKKVGMASQGTETRVKALEVKVRVLTTTLEYVLAGKSLDGVLFDEEGKVVEKGEPNE